MDWVSSQSRAQPPKPFFLPNPPPPPPPPLTPQTSGGGGGAFNLDNKISPSILLIIIILAIIFFISGLFHLLVRFLFRPTTRDPDELDNVTALQGQLQQLFHLHDSGVDQSYIDTLPVFLYKAIIGLKNPFDCAVCLCEFEDDDKLRLLPKCSHAFHVECIDTWLLSHSTCPLCRGSLLSEFNPNHNCSPIVLVLESGGESSREIVSDAASSVLATNTQLGCELESSCNDLSLKFDENPIKDEAIPVAMPPVLEEKVLQVKLGKFRNVEPFEGGIVGEGSSSNFDARRCFSMGSFEYVMDESSSLQVAIKPQARKQTSKKPSMPLTPGRRIAMSECDCNSTRFKGFDVFPSNGSHSGDSKIASGDDGGRNNRDSFSISKIWLRNKKEKPTSSGDSSRRAFSFRLPLQRSEASHELNAKDGSTTSKRSTISDMDVSRWENSELGVDEEVGSSAIMDSQLNMPSFARRTLQWLVGRQNKVVHSSSSPNV